MRPLHAIRVDALTAQDALSILRPKWGSASGKQIRTAMRRVLDTAVSSGHVEANVAGSPLDSVLPAHKPATTHLKALPYAELPNAFAALRAVDGPVSQCLRLLALTACRPQEAAGATWTEIDLHSKTWTIPGERMKTGVEHVVPLSTGALEVLEAARTDSPFVFTGSSQSVARTAMAKLLRTLGIGSVPHGFRSSFRTWAAETGVDREIAERALAHQVGSDVERSYCRTTLLDQRREIMQSLGSLHARLRRIANGIRRSRRGTKAQVQVLESQIYLVCEADHPVTVLHVFYRMTDPSLPEPVEKTEACIQTGSYPDRRYA